MRPSGPIRNVAGVCAELVAGPDAGNEVAGESLGPGQPLLLDGTARRPGVPVAPEADEPESRVAAEGRLDLLERGHLGGLEPASQVAQKSSRTSLP